MQHGFTQSDVTQTFLTTFKGHVFYFANDVLNISQ